MKFIKSILLLLIVVLTGCTTIGQQVTNYGGSIQIDQQNVPLNAQATATDTVSSYPSPFSSSLRHYDECATSTRVIKTTNTNSLISSNSQKITNTVIETPAPVVQQSTNTVIKEEIKSNETNNVTVNVYTESVNIDRSSVLSDAFNYFFE
jgi:hypothetical protein